MRILQITFIVCLLVNNSIFAQFQGGFGDGYDSKSGIIKLNAPELVFPDSNSSNTNISLKFEWGLNRLGNGYIFQLSDNNNLSLLLFDKFTKDTFQILNNFIKGKTYYWRVRALNNIDSSDWSTVWNFTTIASEAVPSSWAYTDFTGSNSTVLVPKNINPKIDTRDFQKGDAVGFFFTRSGSLVCAGYGVWNNVNLAVTVWGDDSETVLKDGFASNEGYTIKIWDAIDGKEMIAEFTVASGPSYYTTNGFTTLATLKGSSTTTHAIYLKTGWNMMSSYVLPTNDSLEAIWRNIENKVTISKNNAGQVYIPSYGINTIGKWNHKHAYQTYMSSADTLKGIWNSCKSK